MDRAGKVRWAILSTAAMATAVASFYPSESAGVGKVEVARRVPAATPAATAMRPAAQLPTQVAGPSAAAAQAAGAESDTDAGIDPFSPRGWQPPPPPPPVPAAVVQAPVAPAPPPGPPRLPFKFMGSMNDGGSQVIYLSRGEQTVVAHAGEVLDETYKVVGIDAQRIEFEHLPTGEKQTLALPASEN